MAKSIKQWLQQRQKIANKGCNYYNKFTQLNAHCTTFIFVRIKKADICNKSTLCDTHW